MLVLWLAAVLVSLAPSLHHLLHDDSQSARHECLVTLLSKGQVLGGPSPVVLGAVTRTCIELPPTVALVAPASADYRLSLSRAPPAPAPFPTVVGWSR